MKRLLAIALLSLLAFAGCDTVGALFNPVIGTWEVTILGVTTENVFHTNGDCTETVTIEEVGITKSGVWDSDGGVITRVWADESTDSSAYSFNSDKSEMTLSPVSGGLSVTYSRM